MDFELAQASSMRMCPELQKKFPDLREGQLELMMCLCLVAYDSEIYDGVCEDAWLRTTITLGDDHRDGLHHVFSHSGSPELRRLIEAGISHGTVLSQESWECLQRELPTLTSRIKIRSNILPCKAYGDRLQELARRQSLWAWVQSSMLRRTSCCVSRRGFFPITVIKQAREEDVPLKQKVKEWRRSGGRCDLATLLMQRSCGPVPHSAPGMRDLREIRREEVTYSESEDRLGNGAAASVYKVSWRNGTYAMKLYEGYSEASDPSRVEREVAARVLHPHIVHGFGYFVADGEYHLLMEVLKGTLFSYLIEQGRTKDESLFPLFFGTNDKPPFSLSNTVDVLLQIARAMEHMHLNEMVHGDLKPQNILLESFEILGNEQLFLAKVTDFGNAQFIDPGRPFRAVGFGSTNFAAPELLEIRKYRHQGRTNENELTNPKKIDVYSFGGVAYEVLTGCEVYAELRFGRIGTDLNRESQARVISGDLKPSGSEVWRNSGLGDRFPPELINLVERCWELGPEDRPSFLDIRETLQRCKSTVQNEENKAEPWQRFIAAVLVLAFICCLPSLSAQSLLF